MLYVLNELAAYNLLIYLHDKKLFSLAYHFSLCLFSCLVFPSCNDHWFLVWACGNFWWMCVW